METSDFIPGQYVKFKPCCLLSPGYGKVQNILYAIGKNTSVLIDFIVMHKDENKLEIKQQQVYAADTLQIITETEYNEYYKKLITLLK